MSIILIKLDLVLFSACMSHGLEVIRACVDKHKMLTLSLFVIGSTLCLQQILSLVERASGILRKWSPFREFLKFIKVFGLKPFFFKKLYLGEKWSFGLHLLWNQKNGVYLINVQILPTKVEFTGYLLFLCFKYNNDWLRIHKLHQCKLLQMIFDKQVLLYI